MQTFPALCAGALAVSAACCALPAQAQSVEELAEQIKAMRQQLDAQRARIEELERDARTARSAALQPAPVPVRTPMPANQVPPMLAGGTVSKETLEGALGTGNAQVDRAHRSSRPQRPRPPSAVPRAITAGRATSPRSSSSLAC